MELKETFIYKFVMQHHKFLSIVEGICIIILIGGLWIMYFSDVEIKKEIRENCGWGEDDYECFCEKSEALALKNKLMGEEPEINLSNLGVPDVDT